MMENSGMKKLTIEQLKKFQKIYTTSVGYLIPGETAFIRGKDIFKDLKDESWFSLLMFSLTGRQFTKNQIYLFESIWALSTSYPDVRLWNNRVAAIAATAGSTTNLSIAAAMATSDTCIFGGGPFAGTYDLLMEAKIHLQTGGSLSDFLQKKFEQQRQYKLSSSQGENRSVAAITGYGRPLVNRDERIIPLLDKAKSLGFATSEYIQIAFDIEKTLYAMNRKMSITISSLMSALCLEQGLTKSVYQAYISMSFLAGIVSVYYDVAAKPRNSFFPIEVSQVIYYGNDKRELPLGARSLI